MVFLEQPAGVGFSYTTDPALLNDFNDYRAAMDNVRIIRSFYQIFPSMKGNSFYLASESYGGHYIPQWTYQLLNSATNVDLRANFKGYLVGNPFTSYASGSIAMANVLWGLQLIPLPAWKLFTSVTCEQLTHDPYFLAMYLPQCFEYLDALSDFMTNLNPYALEFPVCPKQVMFIKDDEDKTNWARYPKLSAQTRLHLTALKRTINTLAKNRELHRHHYDTMKSLLGDELHEKYQRSNLFPQLTSSQTEQDDNSQDDDDENNNGGDDDDYAALNGNFTMPARDVRALQYDPCSEFFAYVQEALHVGPSSSRGAYFTSAGITDYRWAQCQDQVNEGWAFNDYLADTTLLYSKIMNHPNKPKDFKMLVFSGDSDGVCATVGTQNWIYNVQGTNPIQSLYKPWHYNDTTYGYQQAGYLTQFSNFFSFATVHFAGHEVPAYQPERAFALFAAYLNGSLFAGYEAAVSSGLLLQTDDTTASDSSPSLANSHVVPVVIAILLVITAIGGLIVCLMPPPSSKLPAEGEIIKNPLENTISSKGRDRSEQF